MHQYKISIITVVKNGMPYLKDSIKSFDTQSLDNKEHIIVCSPSTDDTENYLQNYQDTKKIIKDDISQNKFGSINIGVQKAQGEFIGLLHADDILPSSDTLAEIYDFIKDTKSDLIYGNIKFCKKKNINKMIRYWKSNPFDKEQLKYGWMPPHTSVYGKSDIIKKIRYSEKFPISGDYKFILELFNNNNLKKTYLNKTLCIMRSGGDSTRISQLFKKLTEDLKIAKLYFKNYNICIILKILRKIKQIYLINFFKNFF